MELMLDFIYCGKVMVQQEELENFLKTGEELKVKGLSIMITPPTDPRMSPSKFISCPDEVSGPDPRENAVSSTPLEPCVYLKSEESREKEDLSLVQEWEDLEKFVVVIKNGKYGSGKHRRYQCSLCGKICKEGRRRMDMMSHIENKHFKNVFTHTCDVCQKTFQTKGLLNSHNCAYIIKQDHKSQFELNGSSID